jgi:hypothetical protein
MILFSESNYAFASIKNDLAGMGVRIVNSNEILSSLENFLHKK